MRIKSTIRYSRSETSSSSNPQILYFEHLIEEGDITTSFAFTYPFTYAMLQDDLNKITVDDANRSLQHVDSMDDIVYQRELLTYSCDGRRIDLVTISSSVDCDFNSREPHFDGLFPDNSPLCNSRPYQHRNKLVVFISARVHPGEVPSQHTFKGTIADIKNTYHLIFP